MPIFENKGKRYNIPDDKVSSFRKSFPDAQVYYNNGGKSYKIPVSKADAFVKSFPKASYSSLEQIDETKPTAPVQAPAAPAAPAPVQGNAQKAEISPDSMKVLREIASGMDLNAERKEPDLMAGIKPTASESTNVVMHNGMKGEDVWKAQEEERRKEAERKKAIEAQKSKVPDIDAEIARIEKEIAQKRRSGGEYMMGSPTTGTYWTGTSDKDIDVLEATLAQLQQQKNKVEAVANDGGVGQSFKDVFTDPDVLTLGLSGSKDAGVMLRIKKKLDKGEALTDAEKGLMQHYQDNAITQQELDPYLNNSYRFGNIAFRSVPFMVEIGMANPLTSGIKTGSRKAATYVAKKGIEDGFKKSAIKALGTTVDDLAAAAVVSNTTQLGHLAQSYQQNRAGQAVVSQDENGNPVYSFEGGKGVLESAYRAEASQIIENYTERLGEHLGAPAKWLKGKINASEKPLVQGLANTLKKATASDAYQAINNGLKKVGFHGFVPEVLEEEAGIPLSYVFLGEGPETWEEAGRQQLDILGGIGLSCGMLSSLQLTAVGGEKLYTGQQYRKAKKQLHKADNVASFRLLDRWEPIREQLDGATNEEIIEVADGILADPELHAQERSAIIDYTRKLLFYRGFNMGTVAAENEGLVSPEENEANKAYVEGNNATEPKDMNAAKILLDDAREKAEQVMASLHLYDDSPIEALRFVNGNPDLYSEQDKRTVLDYVNAKSRYDGMLDRVADDVDSKIDISNRTIERRTNTDGMIHPVIDQTGKTRYLVSGHVETDEDGNVMRQGSDGSLIVIDEDGNLEMVSADALSATGQPISAIEEMENAAETIRQEAIATAQHNIDGVVDFVPGSSFSILNESGDEFHVSVAGADEQGNVVTDVGTFAPDALQTMKDNFTRQQILSQHEAEQAEQQRNTLPESYLNGDERFLIDINGTPHEVYVSHKTNGNEYVLHSDEGVLPTKTGKTAYNVPYNMEQIVSMLHHEEAAPVEDTPVDETSAPEVPAASTEAPVAAEQPAVDEVLPEQPETPVAAPELPRDKDGNLIYHEVPVEETIADIYADFDTKEAGEFISANLEESQKAVEKITSRPPKMTSNKAKYLSDKKKWNEALTDAQKKLDYWSSVREENKKVTAQDTELSQQETDSDEPLDANEYIASVIGPSIKITPDSFRKETGYGAAEQRSMIGSIASADKGGVSIERAAEIIEESGELTKYGFHGDTNDIRGAIIEVLQDGNPRGYASRRKEERNRVEKEREKQELDTFANEAYHMSGEDFLAYEENFIPNVINKTKGFDFDGYENEIALDKEKELEENGRQEIGGHDTSGTGAVHGEGSEVLQTVQPDNNEGTSDAVVGRQAGEIHGGSPLHNQDGTEVGNSGTVDGTPVVDEAPVIDEAPVPVEEVVSEEDAAPALEEGEQVPTSGNPDVTVAAAEGEVNTAPTEAQKAAGNYKKGHLKFDGYEISIENPKGSERSGKDKDGKEWHTTMHNTYGYIRGTEGVDGDHIDVYLSDEPSQGDVYVVDQVNDDGSFDEHKVMYGFNSEEEARQAYLSNYQEGWQGLGNITQVSREDFKKWVDSSHRKTKPFAEYSTTKRRKRGGFFSLKEGVAEQPAVDAGQEIQSKFEEEKAKFANDNPKMNNYAAALQQASNVQEAVDALKGNISSLVAEYKDWAGRKYKKNAAEIEVGSDELSSTHTTIGAVNERRRQNRMDSALRGIEEVEGYIKTLLERSGVPESEHSKYYDGASVRQEINGGSTANETAPANETTVEDEEKLRIESKAPSHVNKDGYVSDATGVPVVLYHGTENADVKSASQLESGHRRVDGEKATFNGDGIFLTPDRSVAEDYAGANGHVLETKVKLKKPFVSYGVLGMDEKEAAEYTDKLKAEGYDGILNYASPQMREMGAMPNEVIVFDKGSIEEESASVDEPVAEESGSYVYRLRLRPFGIGSQPDGGKYVDDGSQFGAVEYDHKLTPEQIDNYSMMPITEAKQLEGKTFAKPFGKFEDIMFHVTSVDENGNVTYETQYKDNKDTETLDYIHFMERLGKKAKEVKQEEKVQEPEEAQPAEKESSYPAGMSNDQTNGLERISRESVAYFKNYFDNWTGEIVTNENSTMNKGKVIETGPAVQLTFDNDGAVSYQTIYGDVDSIKAWIEDYASKHGGKKSLKNVQFSIGTDISQNQSPAEQLTTQAVLTALDKANVPVVVVSEDELKSLGGKAQLSKKQKRLLDAATMERDSILSNPATDTSEQSQPIESSTNDTITDSKDIANVQKELDSLAKSWLNKPNRTKGVISDLTLALGLENENDGPSRYKTFRLGNGELVTFRLSNHNSSVENFDNKGEAEGVSLVISRYNNKNIKNNGIAHVTEHFYSKTELEKAEGNPVSAIISSISDFLNTGRYVDTTGLAQREEVNIPERLAKADGTVYGAAYNGKIYLNQDFINPETPIHEYTHLWANAMQKSNPEGWESVKELLRDTPVWNAVLNDPYYANIRDNEDEVASEALSRISGKQNAARMEAEAREMLDGADVFGKAETIGLLNRMKNALQKFWNWVGKELFNIKKFDSVEEVTDRIMYDLVNGTNLGNTADNKARLHFIGTHGAYHIDQHDKAVNRLGNYEVARKMEDAGEDASEIKMATGWERGADGKWRYEIHDFDRFNHVGNMQFILSHPEIDREVELNIKSNKSVFFGTEPLTEEEREELNQLHEKTKQLDMKTLHKNMCDLKLLDFVQDEDLFTAYPQMKHTLVTIVELEGDTGGYVHSLDFGFKEIVINKKLYDEAQGMSYAARKRLESVFLHEVQHLIQAEEGFARGGSPKMFEKTQADLDIERWASVLNNMAVMDGVPLEQVAKEMLEEAKKDLDGFEGEIYHKGKYFSTDDFYALFEITRQGDVESFIKKKLEESAKPAESAIDKYLRLGGEVEARNVQTRMDMEMDDRRESLAEETEDIAREDQIFMANAYGEYSEMAPASSDKTLVGVHNISDDKLRMALKLGGLANPSVAVINSATQSHEDFGRISLILPSEMLEGERTYTGDAWSPTYPRIIRQLSSKDYNKLSKRVRKAVENYQVGSSILGNFEQYLEGERQNGLEYLFLKENGYEPKDVTSAGLDVERQYFLDLFGIEDDNFTDYEKAKNAPDEAWIEFNKWRYANGKKSIYDYRTQKLQDKLDTYGETEEQRAFIMEPYLVKDFSAFDTFMNQLRRAELRKNEVNVSATLENAKNEVVEKMLGSEFDKWLEKFVEESGAEEVFFDGYTATGNRRYKKATLENISKRMKADGKSNAYNDTGLGATRSMILKQMKSLEEIKSRKFILQTDDEFKEKYDSLQSELIDLSTELASRQADSGNQLFFAIDTANHRIQEALLKKNPVAYLNKEYGYSIGAKSDYAERLVQFKKDLIDMPSKYFETKFERPVLFNEFSAAVVPSSTDDEIKQALKAQGLTVVEYDEKVDGSRQDAFDEAIHQDEGILFRKVEDPSEIMWLENQPHEKAYRAMQVINGKLYPPMAASVHGKLVESRNLGEWEKADERPELAKPVIDEKTGKQKVDRKTGEPVWTFTLNKGGKDATGKDATSVPARYNPYWHSSRSPLNDQFKSAWIRPNLVTVEVEIPSSELTSGYKAERAKDAVGEVEWTSGVVSKKLAKQGNPRRVILSRWDKPVRILSNEEVAQKIADLVLDAGIEIPENVVTPQVRVELEKLGVKIGAPEKGVKKDEQIQEAMERGLLVDNTVTESKPEAVNSPADAVQELAATLNVSPTVIESTKGLKGDKKYAKGWYESKTGNIVVVLPNNRDAEDAKVTLLHEAVAHHGLREMFGEHFNDFLENVFTHASEPVRRKIVDLARKNKYDFHVAIEEYLASLAETTDFENAQQQGWWNKIKQLFFKMLEKVGAKIPALSDNELRYILWRSYQNLKQKSDNSDLFALAQNVSKEYELKVGEYADMDVRKAREADDRSIDSIIAQAKADGTYMKAPNGKPTNLDERQWAQVRTKAFKEWFGDWEKDPENASKVVDENGEPKVVYHGTRNNFTQFDLERSGSNLDYGTAGYGFYFTEDIQNASNIARNSENNGEPKVMEVFLNIKNPLEGVSLTELDGSRKKAIRFTEKAKINGHDGISASRFGLKWHVAFEPTQIKSATENDGLFDPHDPDIRFRMSKPAGPAASEYNEAVRVPNEGNTVGTYENLGNRLREAYQDSMLSLKRLQEAVANETGSEIEDFENAYTAENRMSSENKIETEVYMRDFMNPLFKEVSKLLSDGKTTLDDVNSYLMAKHGLERNVYMREKEARAVADKWEVNTVKKEMEDGYSKEEAEQIAAAGKDEVYQKKLESLQDTDYSGLTELTEVEGEAKNDQFTERAEILVEQFENKHDVTDLWNKINAATKESLRKSYKSGMLSKENYEYIRDMFEYYVPLRGWDNNEAGKEYDYLSNNRMHLSPAVVRMKGRKSKADNVLAFIGFSGESSIIQGNRNLMKQHLLNMAENHPTQLATVSKQWFVLDNASGDWMEAYPEFPEKATPEQVNIMVADFEERMQELKKNGLAKQGKVKLSTGMHIKRAEMPEHTVKVLRNGQELNIYINGSPRAAQAVNGLLNPDNVGNTTVHRWAQVVKNEMARNFTSRNPAFIFSNLARDVVWADAAVNIKEDKSYKRQYRQNISKILLSWKTLSLLKKFENGTLDESNEFERYFKEFLMHGGETGFTSVNTVENYKRDIKRFMKEAQKGVKLPQREWRRLWDGIEFINRSVEDVSRFAVYMTSRQMGRTVERSIWDAKEITVNFNKKGSGDYGARYLNFAYIFFNAAVQSAANNAKLAYHHPAGMAKLIGKYVAFGMLFPAYSILASMMLGGDDDKDAYFDLPKWVRENNLVIYVPFSDRNFITIPLPHELRPYYAIGENALCTLMGKEEPLDAVQNAALSFTSMLPLDFTGHGGNTLLNFTPTAVLPLAEIAANEDFFGKPIYRDTPFNKLKPEWTRAYKGTSPYLVQGTKVLNSLGGGDNVDKSYWLTDINPAKIEHLLEGYLGGMGKFLNRTANFMSMAWDEDARMMRNVPIVSSFVQDADPRFAGSTVNNTYYGRKEELEEMRYKASGYENEIERAYAHGKMDEYENYLNLLKSFYEANGKRYVIIEAYSDEIDKKRKLKEFLGKEEQEKIDKQITKLQKELEDELEKLEAE